MWRVSCRASALGHLTTGVERIAGDSYRHWLPWCGYPCVLEVSDLTRQASRVDLND
jgi:hypothetical protein